MVYKNRWQNCRITFREIRAILYCLNRQDELSRLIAWANRKHLHGPRKAYQIKLDDTERRLFHYQVSSPRLIVYARLLHNLKKVLFPPPHSHRKGATSAYRSKSLDTETRNPIVFVV